MKAILIDPNERCLRQVQVQDKDDIVELIGYDTVISDEIGPDGERMFLDEECFIRGALGRFQLEGVAPVAGRAVVTGASGAGRVLADVASTTEEIERRLVWMS